MHCLLSVFIVIFLYLFSCISAHRVILNTRERSPNVSSKYSVAGGQCWFEQRVDPLPQVGDHDVAMASVTLEECQLWCAYALGWDCLSLKYTAHTQRCELSSTNPEEPLAEDINIVSDVDKEFWEKKCSGTVEEGAGACPGGYFSCKDNGVCVDTSLVCDGEAQCYDSSDEENCADSAATTMSASVEDEEDEEASFCWADEFRCPGTASCLSKILGCDGRVDCPWGEDERGCLSTCPSAKKFSCRDSKRCIPESLVCDGLNDCTDASDETDCAYHCREGQMHCEGSSQCIPEWWACDGQKDCENGADELMDCQDSQVKPQCKQAEFTCKKVNVCIYKKRVCDGHIDCPDGSDEEGCGPKKCPTHEYLCPDTKKCIPKFYLCDYDEDCPGGEDELDCGVCQLTKEFTCWTSGRCIPISWKCNGYQDCSDSSDEKDC